MVLLLLLLILRGVGGGLLVRARRCKCRCRCRCRWVDLLWLLVFVLWLVVWLMLAGKTGGREELWALEELLVGWVLAVCRGRKGWRGGVEVMAGRRDGALRLVLLVWGAQESRGVGWTLGGS